MNVVWVLTRFDADEHDTVVSLHRSMMSAQDEAERVTDQPLVWLKVCEGLVATAHEPLVHLRVWREEVQD